MTPSSGCSRRAVHGPAELEIDSLPQTLKVDARLLLEPAEPFIIKNLRSRGDLDPEVVRRFDLHSSIVGVIRGRDAPFGMLAVQSQRVDAFTEDDLIFVRSLANTLATAIGRIHVDASVGALEAGLAAIVRWSQDAILSASLDGIIFSWNEAAERMFGYTAAEAVGSSVEMLMAPDRVAERRELLERIAGNEGVESFVTQRVAKDGRILDVSLSLSPVRSPDGAIVGASANMRDLTAQMQLEAELGRVERLHSAVVENMRSSVLVLDLESTIVFANRAAHSLLGFAAGELIGRSITEFGQGTPEAAVRERFDQGRVSAEAYESTLQHADGSEVPVSVSTTPLLLDDGSFAGSVALVEDISERLEREAERGRSHALAEAAKEQLRRAARMEAVARMAGGVAHDFNNIVMGIVGYAQLTLARLDADDPARTYLAEILHGTDDAVALISQFTAFGRGEQPKVRPIDLNAAISEIGRLLRSSSAPMSSSTSGSRPGSRSSRRISARSSRWC